MYVIVEIAGLQYKVEKDQQIYVNRLKAEEGDSISFDKVLLSHNGSVEVGAPVIDGMSVQAKVLEHLRGDKIIVFKKKRRKGYKVKNGYRPSLTKIEITSIGAGSSSKKSETKKKAAPAKKEVTPKKEAAPKAEKAATQEAKPKKETIASKKVSAKKEADPKKTTKKATSKKASSKGDDLKKVEGIGPKVMGIFNEAGINTFAELAAKTSEELKEILTPHGGRYAGMNTDTWPKQAQLAAEGKWEELQKWQDELDGGKEK